MSENTWSQKSDLKKGKGQNGMSQMFQFVPHFTDTQSLARDTP